MKPRKSLSTFSAWAIAFGCIVGWGSMVMPGTTFLPRAGTVGTMLAMQSAALIMLIMSYNYAYMIRKFPDSGGQFIFAEKAFGRTHGFICAWFLGLCYIMIIPMNATALCLIFRALSENDALQFGFHYVIYGYDVYFGEVLLAVLALSFFAYVCSRRVEAAGMLQSFFVALLLLGVMILVFASFFSPNVKTSNLLPMFHPKDSTHDGAFAQVISILVLAPWMYVGFDTVPQLAEESKFPPSRSKFIMDTSILAGCFVYVAMTFISAAGISPEYPDWVSYVKDIANLTGISGIAAFSAAHNMLGETGIIIIAVTALMAMLTGILGFYVATSRLLYSLSRDKMLPSWFGKLNTNSVPMNAVIFCALVSLPAAFVGRNALGWTVDMSSIGGAISLGYTSLAAVKFSRTEGRTDITIFGVLGFVLSVLFAFFLLVPISYFDCSLETPSYILLVIWAVLGGLFFRRVKSL